MGAKFLDVPDGDVCLAYKDNGVFVPVLLTQEQHKLLNALVSSLTGGEPLIVDRKVKLELKENKKA